MRVPSYKELGDALRRNPDVKTGVGATGEEIIDAEARLGTRFPVGYKSFLEDVGWARVGKLSVLGLGRGIPEELNLLRAATTKEVHLPENMLAVARGANRSTFCLDMSYEGPYEPPVYQVDPEVANSMGEYVGHDFVSWLWIHLAEMERSDGG